MKKKNKIHFGWTEHDGETNKVVHIETICKNGKAEIVSNIQDHVTCKECLKILYVRNNVIKAIKDPKVVAVIGIGFELTNNV